MLELAIQIINFAVEILTFLSNNQQTNFPLRINLTRTSHFRRASLFYIIKNISLGTSINSVRLS